MHEGHGVWRSAVVGLHWSGKVCPMPWIVGETGFSANDRYEYPHTDNGPEHHAWPYMHGTEAEQAEFTQRSPTHTRLAGASGWSCWAFQESRWFSFNPVPPPPGDSRELYFGMLHLGAPGDAWPEKPAVDVVRNYVPAPYPTTPGSEPANYINPQNLTGPPWLTGTVTINGEPAKDVVAELWAKNPRTTLPGFDLVTYKTFTTSSGAFALCEHPQLPEHDAPQPDNLALLSPGCKVGDALWRSTREEGREGDALAV